jgi:hypothetical protein
MNGESFEQLERQIAAVAPGAPAELRAVVLADVRRELRAARWDRRFARAAAAAVLVGVGWNALNVALAGRGAAAVRVAQPVLASTSAEALVQTAATVAEATDAATGRLVARQLAALGGQRLSAAQAAAIDAAVVQGSGFRLQ